jgi:hypothetical protein
MVVHQVRIWERNGQTTYLSSRRRDLYGCKQSTLEKKQSQLQGTRMDRVYGVI